jgi:hypothetical protein
MGEICARLMDEAREALFEVQKAIDAGDRDAPNRTLGRVEALARTRQLLDEARRALP